MHLKGCSSSQHFLYLIITFFTEVSQSFHSLSVSVKYFQFHEESVLLDGIIVFLFKNINLQRND